MLSGGRFDSNEEFWDDLWERKGRRAIATRTKGLSYADSGRRDRDRVLESAKLDKSPHSVLEIGSGDGRIAQAFAEIGCDLTAVEPAPKIADKCEEALGPYPGSSVLCGGIECVSALESASFDLVYSAYVLQHIPDRSEIMSYLSESSRLLKPGGVAVHQVRRKTAYSTAHQTTVDVIRLPTGMPSFTEWWRGYRLTEEDLDGVASLVQSESTVQRCDDGFHTWITMIRLQ